MFQGCRKSPGVSLLLEWLKARFAMLTPPPPVAPQWGLEMPPQVGEMLPGMSVLPIHAVFLLFSPACTSLSTVSKNNVFMPSTFCEPSAGNSDSEPGETSRAFALHQLVTGGVLG